MSLIIESHSSDCNIKSVIVLHEIVHMGFVCSALKLCHRKDCVSLLQSSNGLGGLLGGPSSTTFGSQSGNVLTKTTYVLVTVFFVLILGLALINKTPKTSAFDEAFEGAAVEETTTTSTEEYWLDDTTEVETTETTTEAVAE